MRIIAFAMIIIGFTGYGFTVTFGKKNRIRFLENLVASLDFIKKELVYSKPTLIKLLQDIACLSDFSNIGFYTNTLKEIENGKEPSEAFDIGVNIAKSEFSLTAEDTYLIKQIPDIFSCENTEVCENLISRISQNIIEVIQVAKEKYKLESKLYRGLSIISGIFVVILLL